MLQNIPFIQMNQVVQIAHNPRTLSLYLSLYISPHSLCPFISRPFFSFPLSLSLSLSLSLPSLFFPPSLFLSFSLFLSSSLAAHCPYQLLHLEGPLDNIQCLHRIDLCESLLWCCDKRIGLWYRR